MTKIEHGAHESSPQLHLRTGFLLAFPRPRVPNGKLVLEMPVVGIWAVKMLDIGEMLDIGVLLVGILLVGMLLVGMLLVGILNVRILNVGILTVCC